MITKNNIPELLVSLGYSENNSVFSKTFNQNTNRQFSISVDIDNEKFIYPKEIAIHRETTTNFSDNENFVVFEIINRLFDLGYMPKNIELEMLVKVGRGRENVTAWADVLIKDNSGKYYAIIEAKTYGDEFSNAWKKTLNDGYQLFSYVDQLRSNQSIPYGVLYASDFRDGKVERKYHLLTFKDNDEFLKEQKKKKRKLYVNSSNEKELFEVWKTTYDQDYSPIGMFEDDSKPFGIMEKQFTIKDIYNNPLETDGLIHQFRTILRQHNVSGRENAFDRLLNLLLAKVVDEKQSEQTGRPLDFYWRGVAFDDKKALVDRLQRLYRDGMRDYLKEDVTYIDKNDVDNAFVLFKNDRDATRDLIQHYFEKLKFYTDNFFAFIDVYNEDLFEKNFEILSSIVRLLQDVSLTNSEQHQFLGDLFEKLLDQGIKQSEGQFFTPLPIVRFIVSSLPIKDMIENGQVPKVIDYASGSGHFLTEYASIISKLEIPSETLPTYYQNINGIEKESRLAKVSKVSALMYGATETQIFFHDALSKFEEVKDGSFDVIIANPPYSVTGFLETLSEEDRNNFELSKYVSNLSTNKAIEAFFLERAKQLLKPGGIAAIILPSSILQKSEGVFVNVRKQLLESFDIIAIFEAGSGTFGKTGTTTNTLFLRKKASKINLLNHYTNRVTSWYKKDFDNDIVFEDKEKLQAFSELLGKTIDNVLEDENLKERLIYYLLAEDQENDVQIIKTPSTNLEIKKFLGYEWSNRKGSEGIQYLSGDVQKIETPLYSPSNYEDSSKVNWAIRENFLNNDVENKMVKKVQLSKLIDWTRDDFDLLINTYFTSSTDDNGTPTKKMNWSSQFPLTKVKNLLDKVSGDTTKIPKSQILEAGRYPVITQEKDKFISGYSNATPVTDIPLVLFGDHSCSVKYIDFDFVRGADGTVLLKTNDKVIPRYLYIVLSQNIESLVDNFGKYQRHFSSLKEAEIPVPPIPEQKKIIEKFNHIEKEQQKAQQEKAQLQSIIAETLEKIKGDKRSLSDFFEYSNKKVQSSSITFENYVGVDNLVKNMRGKVDSIVLPTTATVNKYVEGDILLSNIRPYLMKIWFADSEGGASNDVLVLTKISKEINPKFAYYQLARKEFFDYEMLATKGMKMPRGDKNHIMQYKIEVPLITEQDKFLEFADSIEEQIKDLQHTIENLELEKDKLFNK